MKTPETWIHELVQADLPNLAPHLRAWAEAHLAAPRQGTFSESSEGTKPFTLWLVTDNTGTEDSSLRVVFDQRRGKFGLAMELRNGIHWFTGLYGSFSETIKNM
jgi:hypothetical protein